MADNKIRFDIGSVFSGEGFKAADKAISANRKQLEGTKVGLGEIKNAIADISPAADKAIGAVTGIGNAFLIAGIIGGGIQLALTGVAEGIKWVKEKCEEATNAAKAFSAAVRDEIGSAISASRDRFAELVGQMSAANAQAKELVASLNGSVASAAEADVHRLHIETLQKITDDMSAGARAVVEAEGAMAEQAIRSAAAIEIAQNNVQAASDVVKSATEKRALAEERLAAAEENLKRASDEAYAYTYTKVALEKKLAEAQSRQTAGVEDAMRVQREIKAIRVQLAEHEKKYSAEAKLLSDATRASNEAKRELAAAQFDVARAERQATSARDAERNARLAAAEAEQEAALKIRDANKRLEEEKAAVVLRTQKEAEAAKKAEEAAKKDAELSKAKEERTAAEKKRAEETKAGKGKDKDKGVLNANLNVKIDAGQMNELKKPRNIDPKVWEAIVSGKATTRQWQAYERALNREKRAEYNRLRPDMTRIAGLMQKPRAMWTQEDRAFFETYKTRVAPTVSKKMALELVKEGQRHFLTAKKYAEGTNTDKKILRYLKEALGIQ